MIDHFLYTRCISGLTLRAPGHDVAAASSGLDLTEAKKLSSYCKYENQRSVKGIDGRGITILSARLTDSGDYLLTHALPRRDLDGRETFLAHALIVRKGSPEYAAMESDPRLLIPAEDSFITQYQDGASQTMSPIEALRPAAEDYWTLLQQNGVKTQTVLQIAWCAVLSFFEHNRCLLFMRQSNSIEQAASLLRCVYSLIPQTMRIPLGYTTMQVQDSFTRGVTLSFLPDTVKDQVSRTGKLSDLYVSNEYVIDLDSNSILFGAERLSKCGEMYNYMLQHADNLTCLKNAVDLMSRIQASTMTEFVSKANAAVLRLRMKDEPQYASESLRKEWNACADTDSVLRFLRDKHSIRDVWYPNEKEILSRLLSFCGDSDLQTRLQEFDREYKKLSETGQLSREQLQAAYNACTRELVVREFSHLDLIHANEQQLSACVSLCERYVRPPELVPNYPKAKLMLLILENPSVLLSNQYNERILSRNTELYPWLDQYYFSHSISAKDYPALVFRNMNPLTGELMPDSFFSYLWRITKKDPTAYVALSIRILSWADDNFFFSSSKKKKPASAKIVAGYIQEMAHILNGTPIDKKTQKQIVQDAESVLKRMRGLSADDIKEIRSLLAQSINPSKKQFDGRILLATALVIALSFASVFAVKTIKHVRGGQEEESDSTEFSSQKIDGLKAGTEETLESAETSKEETTSSVETTSKEETTSSVETTLEEVTTTAPEETSSDKLETATQAEVKSKVSTYKKDTDGNVQFKYTGGTDK